jgi:hypothetical protein
VEPYYAASPEMQSILALCHHPAYESGCEACEFRRVAAAEHLSDLAARALGILPPAADPGGTP